MRAKNPKFRVRAASFIDDGDFNVGTEASPSFDLRMSTQFTATIEKGRARIRSTKKVNVVVELRSSSLSSNATDRVSGSDISSGVLPLTSYSKLEGKIHSMKVIKRKKSARMNCTMEIDIHSRKLGNIICK
ncbi:Detected protein of unknown function [Hibiscus syriacus]|uniref:Late embryogenesis abundant protein LEA-2 subgroup domain-containing protein n=1 Tax=Hibiscus syriacus TaxID=106335 RepID=A0A6A2XJG5_HIBSY|nr:Detected protein of unknown function [Hibiscus syriacus]